MEKENTALKFEFNNDEKEAEAPLILDNQLQMQLLGTVAMMANVGWKTLEGSDWKNLTEVAPVFSDISPDKETFLRYSRACVEIFGRWQQYESDKLLKEETDKEMCVEDVEDAMKKIHQWHKENQHSWLAPYEDPALRVETD